MKVAVAIISDEQKRILITQRPLRAPHGGYWEFPGGKLEANESAEEALIREIREEIGLEISQYELLGQITHDYPDKTLQLIVFRITQHSGTPSCLEGQLGLKWIKKEEMKPEEFPAANHAILDLI